MSDQKQRTVFVVVASVAYETYRELLGVFATREAAEKCAKRSHYGRPEIEEWNPATGEEVLPAPPEQKKLHGPSTDETASD